MSDLLVFPQCRWGGAIDGDRRPCASPKLIVPRAGVTAQTCMSCRCQNHAPVSRRLELPRRGMCLHLLAEREQRICKSCGGHVEVKVFGCDKHTLCTLGKPMDDLACCATCKDHQTLGPVLTFGMASCRNGVETWFTLQGFLALCPPCSFEMLVCDNSPGGDKAVKDAAEECGARYVLTDEVSGTAYPRDRVFREARGQIVLCVDSHVLLLPGSIEALLAYYQMPDRAKDMVHGPLLTSDHKGVHWTHWEPAWREGMFGTAASDHAALKRGEPFAIPLAGCGLMACKKDAWPGFNPAFKSFGSEEGYIQEKVRRNGGRVVCVPGVRWSHKFFHLGGQRTRYDPADLIANYLIGHRELGWDERPLLDHFRARNGPEQIDRARARAAERLGSPPSVPTGRLVRLDHANIAPDLQGHRINSSLLADPTRPGYLFAYRDGWMNKDVWLVRLGMNLQPEGRPWMLNLSHPTAANYNREDPRLFVHAGRVHVAYAGVAGNSTRYRPSVLYARLSEDCALAQEVYYPHYARRNRWEKNWGFFSHEGALYAVYSFAPHRILRIDGNLAEDFSETPTMAHWGPATEIRGGASPVRVGDEYWVFAHSSTIILGMKTYMVVLYTFEARPPFAVRRIISEPILIADRATKPADQYCAVVFPCGAVREASGDWLISMGVHDRWSEICRFRHADMEERLGKP